MNVGDPFGESEQSALDTQPVACRDMMGLRLVRVTDVLSLGGGEIPVSDARLNSLRRRSRRSAGIPRFYIETVVLLRLLYTNSSFH